MGAAPLVIVNGRRVGTLRNGEAFYRDARPGRYRVYLSSAKDDVVELTLAPGARAFVTAGIAWRMLGFRLVAQPVEAAEAEAAMAGLQRVTGLWKAICSAPNPDPPDLEPHPGYLEPRCPAGDGRLPAGLSLDYRVRRPLALWYAFLCRVP